MPLERGDSEGGRELARRSAQARRRLTLERVEVELGGLDTLEDVNRWLHQIGLWGAAGLLPGVVLGGLVRACEIKLRALDHAASRELIDGLRKRLEDLEAKLARQRRGGGPSRAWGGDKL